MIKNDKIELQTFFPFSKNHCNNTKTIKVINEFSDGKWKNENFFPDKISNFHGCTVRLGVSPAFPAMIRKEHKNGTEEFSGSDIKIITQLAKILNFQNKIIYTGFWGSVFENGTTNRLFKELNERRIDYGAGWYFLSIKRGKKFDFTQPHFFVPIVVIVPPGNQLFINFSLIIFRYQQARPLPHSRI
jgi:ABC-type amino acid transport substrate-binding protein